VATLVAIGYPDQLTAEQARATVQQLESELIIQADQVRDYLKPGTSALFMVIEQATPDKAIAALQQYGGTVIKTSLSEEDTKKLQDALQPPASVGTAS
jgi:uncharacterized membrane protein